MMSLFRRSKPEPPPTKEQRIMKALWELSRENGGNFVSSLDVCKRLGQDALSLGLSNTLQRLEDRGLIEHHQFADGTGGDRPTMEGLTQFELG